MTNSVNSTPGYFVYAQDLMTDREYRDMTLAERGLLLSMMNECWVTGSVPSNLKLLAKALNVRPDAIKNKLTEGVTSFFLEEDGRLFFSHKSKRTGYSTLVRW